MTASGAEVARGHALHHGDGTGTAFVTGPVSFWGGVDWTDGRIIDVHHERHGESLTGRVLVMPYGRGSSSAAVVLAELIRNGAGPVAVVTRSTDVILLVGAMAAVELYGRACPILELDADAFERVCALGEVPLTVTCGDEDGGVALAGSAS
jgi:predicted aconitase with swiveling domain